MGSENPIWEGVYHSFREVPSEGPGFDGEAWLSNSLKKITYLRDEATKSTLVPPPSNSREVLMPLLAALVYSEQRNIKILDIGGGIGFTYYQTLGALSKIENIEYHIVEKETVCEAGRNFFGTTTAGLYFHSEIPQGITFDIAYLGSALHYIEGWQDLLARLGRLRPKYLLMVEVPAGEIPKFVTAQNHYNSRIPVHFFNLKELILTTEKNGFELIYKSIHPSMVLGVERDLPMEGFEKQYRLKNACNLLFRPVTQ